MGALHAVLTSRLLLGVAMFAIGVLCTWAGASAIRSNAPFRKEWLLVALGMLISAPAIVYFVGHLGMLAARNEIESGRQLYTAFGDPRLNEERSATVAGWVLDCTSRIDRALVGYSATEARIQRTSHIGEAGANFVGGDSLPLDFTVEHLYREQLREPAPSQARRPLHRIGRDLRLAICHSATARAWELLKSSNRQGAVVVQNVRSGEVVAYAATGTAATAPLGVKRYERPGSVFKLALAALWWEKRQPDLRIPCPSQIQAGAATVRNARLMQRPSIRVPHEMLVISCNTAAVAMAGQLRSIIGTAAFVSAYRLYGFAPYAGAAPAEPDTSFWSSSLIDWKLRMSPAPSRIRMSDATTKEEWAQLAIGQGPIDVTVLGVSRFIQAIGNNGLMLKPTIEQRFAAPKGNRIVTTRTAKLLQGAMRDAVRLGTGRAANSTFLEQHGWTLGGKTGTAQVEDASDDGWFASLLFDNAGVAQYSIVVFLVGGGPGGDAPARIAGSLATRLVADHRTALRQ